MIIHIKIPQYVKKQDTKTVKKHRLDIHRVTGTHPLTGQPLTLKWYRGAGRYNNGATRYGNKYWLRWCLGYIKTKPYTEHELEIYKQKQGQ